MSTKFKLEPLYYFGKDVVKNNLDNELKLHKAKTILLLFGGGSIKKNGLYQEIIDACKRCHIKVIEYPGIEPNPRDTTIYNAGLVARKNKVDLIIAAGGGSVIDAAKVVGIIATNPQYKNAWDYILDNSKTSKPSIPLFSIITLAATGSENNDGSVVTNAKTKYKMSTMTPTAIPRVCFEDPKYQLTLSKWQTACGIFDIFSHLMEQYFDVNKNFLWTTEYIFANMRVVLACAKVLMKNPKDISARSNILWTSSMALNSIAKFETSGGDWTTHRLEHAVSGLWDVEHGAGLALITPVYLKYKCTVDKRFKELCLSMGHSVFATKTLNDFFKSLENFIKLLGLPTKYTDFKNITKVTPNDIQFLNEHFNSAVRNNDKVASFVFDHIKK